MSNLHSSVFVLIVLTCETLFANGPSAMDALETSNPYYPHLDFPALRTPKWVGEDDVEAVVVLAIDDMRDPQKYEAYLRPILQRLKQIDGRAPVSIMTNKVNPQDAQLQSWLDEGLSIEVHTVDHPCPLLSGGDFSKAKSTYDRCVDLIGQIPGNRPVAFRMPCCDSLNTVSPRFFAEIFSKTTNDGNYLQIDTSVFQFFTSDDPAIPEELVLDKDHREKFLKYMPKDRGFVNYIKNYPYPYVIDGTCWEFPCVAPSDWSAQHRQGVNNPVTVNDWKAAIDITVIKQGVFCLVFHPHGWIRNDQIVELIDHAVTQHGTKIKFLTFREAADRLNKNLLQVKSLREPGAINRAITRIAEVASRSEPTIRPLPDALKTFANAVRYADINEDGFQDLVFSDPNRFEVRLYDVKAGSWSTPILSGDRGNGGPDKIPPIVLSDGSDNGFFVHSRSLCWQNENTDKKPHLIQRVTFDELLKAEPSTARSSAAGLKSIHVREGLTVDLVVAEPLVMDPVAFDWGFDGSLWVAEMADYPLGPDGKGTPGGRIRRLTDTDADGQYDQSVVFLDHVAFPNGVMAWKKGVLVSAAPDIFYAEDTNGDGKADKRELLFTGFAEGNQQHRANGFSYGVDHWIYVANGDSNGRVKSLKTGQVVDISGRDLRIRPATGEIEAVAGRTQFGRNRDDAGNWFGCNNSNPMYHFVLDDAYLRRNSKLKPPNARHNVPKVPGNAPVFPLSTTIERFNDFHTADRFTSACSTRVFRDTAMGKQYYGNAFTCEPVHNLISRAIMSPHGVTFSSQRAIDETDREFLASTDNWFRPVFCRTGPDGALWIADMYRHVIEHPQWIPPDWQERLDLRAGHDRGRIYRVRSVRQSTAPFQRLDMLSNVELVNVLADRNGWRRDAAQRLLIQRQAHDIAEHLVSLAGHDFDQARLSALCTLDGLRKTTADQIVKALDDSSAAVRRHAIRLSEGFADSKNNTIRTKLLSLTGDEDPQVRLQLAFSLGEWNDTGTALAAILSESDDTFLTAATLSSLNETNLGEVFDALMDRPTAPDATVVQTVASQAATLPAVVTSMSAKLSQLPRERYARACQARYAIYASQNHPALLMTKDCEINKADELFRREPEKFTQHEREWATRWSCAVFRNGGRQFQNVNTLTLDEFFKQWFGPGVPVNEQLIAVDELGRIQSNKAADFLMQHWRTATPAVRQKILDQLFSRDDWIKKLLDAAEGKRFPVTEIDASRRQQLLANRDTDIRKRATAALKLSVNADRQKVVDAHTDVLRLTSDIAAGRVIFEKRCSSCHQLQKIGKKVGPDLASLTDQSPRAILTAMLDPNRAVEAKYIAYTAVTDLGRTHSGLITNESGNAITLRSTDGKDVTLLRSELEELVSTRMSFMPEGLEKDLAHQDFANVIGFVRSATGADKPKSFAGNTPGLVESNTHGILRLTARNCEIHGPSLIFENYHGNLGFWGSTADHADWTIEVPVTGRYRVSLHYACDPPAANNEFTLRIGQTVTNYKVAATKNWDSYRLLDLGTVELTKGQQRAEVRATEALRGHLMDFKEFQLTPAE
jgi:putative membrane-bound dehydrogenase-like protein